MDDDDFDRKSSYCSDPDYLVYDHQTYEVFIVTCYIATGIDQDGTLILPRTIWMINILTRLLTFDIFKLDFINDDHFELQHLEGSLGDRAFFIGSNTYFALSTTQFPELILNFIYFSDNQTQPTSIGRSLIMEIMIWASITTKK